MVVDSIGEQKVLLANAIEEGFREGICLYDNCFLVSECESRSDDSFWTKAIEPYACHEVKDLVGVADVLNPISVWILERNSISIDALPA